MVDEESQDVAPKPPGGAPVNRDDRRDPGVIDGRVASPSDDDAAPQPAAEASPSDAQQSRPAAKAPRARGFLWGALGGLVVSALALGGADYVFAPKVDVAEADASRIAALETQATRDAAAAEARAQREDAALAAIEKRVRALEASNSVSGAGLDKRVGALEAEYAAEAPKFAALTQTARDLSGEVKDLRAERDVARGEIPDLAARVAKLESGAPQTGAAAADLSGLVGRLDKIEAQLAAPKVETRVAPEKPAGNDNPAAVAIVAEALSDKLAAGAPFPNELAALEKLGVEPNNVAALKALVNGGADRPLTCSVLRSRSLKGAGCGRAEGRGRRLRPPSRPSARPRSGARPERDGRRRSRKPWHRRSRPTADAAT